MPFWGVIRLEYRQQSRSCHILVLGADLMSSKHQGVGKELLFFPNSVKKQMTLSSISSSVRYGGKT